MTLGQRISLFVGAVLLTVAFILDAAPLTAWREPQGEPVLIGGYEFDPIGRSYDCQDDRAHWIAECAGPLARRGTHLRLLVALGLVIAVGGLKTFSVHEEPPDKTATPHWP